MPSFLTLLSQILKRWNHQKGIGAERSPARAASPLFVEFSSNLIGLTSIRAAGLGNSVQHHFERLLDLSERRLLCRLA
jgi:hypothetical protein